MFWYGLIIGFFIGCNVGLLVTALCVSAKKGNHDVENSLTGYKKD
jgi:uncharacterized membrane-anchored protein YhcB (DUF1043 family)